MIKIKKGIIENQMYFNSSVEMLDNAHNLRLSATTAEALLWEKLRNRNLNGLKFRRQHAIAGFIADFYCHEIRLIIEVDGSIHNESNQNQRDEDRTFELEKLGLKIIRFTNEEIKSNINKVLYKIVEEVNNFIPSPFPSPSGEGRSEAHFDHEEQRGEALGTKQLTHLTPTPSPEREGLGDTFNRERFKNRNL